MAGIVTRYGLESPVVENAPVQTGSVAHPASCKTGNASIFPGLNQPGSWVDHTLPFSVEANERVEVSPLALHDNSRENFTFTNLYNTYR